MTAPTKNYQVKFTRTAAHELKEIIAYIAKHNRTAAQRLHNEIMSKLTNILGTNPYIAPVLSQYPALMALGYRRLLLHPHYSALYIIQGNIVTIMHIWDNRRNWTHLF